MQFYCEPLCCLISMSVNYHNCKIYRFKLTFANMPRRPHYCCSVTKLIYHLQNLQFLGIVMRHFYLYVRYKNCKLLLLLLSLSLYSFLAKKFLLFFILFFFQSTEPSLLKLLIKIVEVEVEDVCFH